MYILTAVNVNEWRDQARRAIASAVPPNEIQWQDSKDNSLFAMAALPEAEKTSLNVPKEFIRMMEVVACHCDTERWHLLYQALWRLLFEEKNLLKIASDPLINRLNLMVKAVRRDAHKTKAFVRFCRQEENGEEHYIAWHDPDHNIIRLVAPFFQRRFAVMKWTIMTPYETAQWDGEELNFLPGVPRTEAPLEDSLEQMWQTYYRSTFNPARIKLKMMKREMPVRYWKTMPETQLIPSMLKEAEQRVTNMMEIQHASLLGEKRKRHHDELYNRE